jgi:hypothetical protein
VSTEARRTVICLLTGLAGVIAISAAAGAGPIRASVALVLVYALGYVTGSLLLSPRDDRESVSLAVIRVLAGLLLASIAFLLSLLLALPWFAGPAVLFFAALLVHRRSAFVLPRPHLNLSRDGILAGLLSAVILAPIVVGALRMAWGPFPPLFFHVDTPYFLEKVHALVTTDTYPPVSLGVAGGVGTYHYGIHGLTALIARGSGLAPHHALFLVVVPLLAIGIAAAANAVAEILSPVIPAWIAVPLLLIPVPTLWYPFWAEVGSALVRAVSAQGLGPLDAVSTSYELWGVTVNPATNIASQFIVLASLAGVAASSTRGWRLPAFFIGSAILFKGPTGVALCAGLAVFLACTAAISKNPRVLMPGVWTAAVLALMYGAFFVLAQVPGGGAGFEPALFYHLRLLGRRGNLFGFWLDMIWLFLPVGILMMTGWGVGTRAGLRRSVPLLGFALAPVALVNALQFVDSRPGGFGVDDNGLQVLVSVAVVFHGFALCLANDRWALLGRTGRSAFLVAITLTILPAAFVAARYTRVLVVNPTKGHEFVDNRPLAAALSAIPVEGSLIVTNDLRYPADDFRRDDRQMQIPALFGHAAFAVNFAYEHYDFSDERREAQNLLQAGAWSAAIDDTARRYGWTHLLIRNDYRHPVSIPLEKVFDSGTYSVYRFEADQPRGHSVPAP